VSVEVNHLVPGDIVHLGVGSIVPADLRILSASNLECDESILTGESVPAEKSADPVPSGAPLAELSSCLFMGAVVHAGATDAVVVAIGSSTQFGRIAVGLDEHHPQTEFQLGLTRFSGLLAKVGGVLSATIFVINVVLGRPVIDAVPFSLAVAVGITPQLLPAVVSTSLATGSRRLAEKKVLVNRLVCIEDLGDIDVLFTDKTGNLTDGHISFLQAIDTAGKESIDAFTLGLVCNEATPTADTAVGGNPLTSPSGMHPARRPASSAGSSGWPSSSSITKGVACRCSPATPVKDSSSPRALPRRSSNAARTSPTTLIACSPPSSAPATAWSPSPPGWPPTSPRSPPTMNTT
jgi:P-type Mg2+ transporter